MLTDLQLVNKFQSDFFRNNALNEEKWDIDLINGNVCGNLEQCELNKNS